jgi:anti-anti-sigma factor
MLHPSAQVRDQNGVLVAEFWDCLRLDPAPVGELRGQYEAILPRVRRADLVVDFLGVDYAGSAALGGMVRLQKLCRQHGGRLVLCNLGPMVFEVFRLSRLAPLFTFVADRPAARTLLRAGPGPANDPTPVTPVLPRPLKPPDEIGPGASPSRSQPEP